MMHMGLLEAFARARTVRYQLEVLLAEYEIDRALDQQDNAGLWLLSFLTNTDMRQVDDARRDQARRALRHYSYPDPEIDPQRRIFLQSVGVMTTFGTAVVL